jgi:hypothetical protein
MNQPASAYAALLELARRQIQAAERGDLTAAIALMPARADLLASAGAPSDADHDAIREVLRLDRDLATALRRRMIAIRNEAVGLQQGRTALAGYQPPLGERRPRRLNALG